jgi:hypothetical protein
MMYNRSEGSATSTNLNFATPDKTNFSIKFETRNLPPEFVPVIDPKN